MISLQTLEYLFVVVSTGSCWGVSLVARRYRVVDQCRKGSARLAVRQIGELLSRLCGIGGYHILGLSYAR
ncbi:Uncharacterised protein [Mycobacterium tuberculosis]|nr:Uncharacterised protein [Mycobacterium tuberculosis]